MEKDVCIKALAMDEMLRVYLLKNTDTINEAINKHGLWPSAAAVLGKTMSIAQMMGCMLKGDEALSIKIQGNGQIGRVVVDVNGKGEVRGFAEHPHINFVNNKGGLNDYYTLGDEGIIEVIKDLRMKRSFSSSIALTGNIAQDFTNYFMISDQSRSLVSLGILINDDNTCLVSGGIIIQLLPNANEEVVTYVEENAYLLNNLSSLLMEKDANEILNMLFGTNYEILDTQDVCFKCSCSKESFSRGLLTLGSKQLEEILNEDGKIETKCFYCNKVYNFSSDEIKNLIAECIKYGK